MPALNRTHPTAAAPNTGEAPPLDLSHQHEPEPVSVAVPLNLWIGPVFDTPSLKLLLAMDPVYAAQVCAKMLASEDPKCANALEWIKEAGVDPWSVAVAGGPRAWRKLVSLGVRPGEVPTLKLAASSVAMDRQTASEALRRFPSSPEALDALLILTRAGGEARSWAVHSLGAFSAFPKALAALVALARDSQWRVRLAAAESLGSFPGSTEAASALLELTKDGSKDIRKTAERSLLAFPPAPPLDLGHQHEAAPVLPDEILALPAPGPVWDAASIRMLGAIDPDHAWALCRELLKGEGGHLPEGFDLWGLADEEGRTVAHEAARWQHLPEGFDRWDLADKTGWTVAHMAATWGRLPQDFDQWGLVTKEGLTVADVAGRRLDGALGRE